MPAAKLRSLAVAHQIETETLVSLDGLQWMRRASRWTFSGTPQRDRQRAALGRKCNSRHKPSATSAAGAKRKPSAASPAGANKSVPAGRRRRARRRAPRRFPWPVVRVRRRGWGRKKEIVRLSPDSISTGVTKEPISDELLTADDWSSSVRKCVQTRRADIQSIRVKRAGFITASSLWSRFEVVAGGKRQRFRVPDRELPNVVSALRQIAGDRFLEKPSRRLSRVGWAQIVFAVLGLLAFILKVIAGKGLGLSSTVPALDFIMAVGLIVALIIAIITPIFAVQRWESEYRATRRKRRRRRVATARRPFRSAKIGWGLKVVGLSLLRGNICDRCFCRRFSTHALCPRNTRARFSGYWLPALLAII